jgi:hypothetical protein
LKPAAGFGCQGTSNRKNVGVYLWRHREQALGWAFGAYKREGIVLTIELGRKMCALLSRDDEFMEDESEAWVCPITIPHELIRCAQIVPWRRMRLEAKQLNMRWRQQDAVRDEQAKILKAMAAKAGA